MKKKNMTGLLFLSPLLLGLLIFKVYGFVLNIYYSFLQIGSFGKGKFIGLQNYVNLFKDEFFLMSVKNTIRFVVICVPLIVIFSTLMAVLLNKKTKYIGIFRTIFFLPAVTLPITVMLIGGWIFNTEYGIINAFLMKFGLDKINWFGSTWSLTTAFTVILVWSSISIPTLIILAGLQEVSPTYYEAAEIDGANPIQKFFKITLPLISPLLFYVFVTNVISMFQLFSIVYLLIPSESGNPARLYASTIVYYYYLNAFSYDGKRGYAAAISIALLIIILLCTWVSFVFQKKLVHYDD